MAYKGIVSRGDHDRGVTLRTKVVSPNKRFSKTKDYHVRISAKTMSDEEKVLAAISMHKKQIIEYIEQNSGDLNNILSDFKAVLLRGDKPLNYGTDTTYTIRGDISKCFDKEFNIISRPKYGSNESTEGTIELTTTLNSARMKLNIPIAMQPIELSDIINTDMFSQDSLWDRIRGYNKQKDTDNNTYRIDNQINIQNTIPRTLLANYMDQDAIQNLVTYEWTIEKDYVSEEASRGNNYDYAYAKRLSKTSDSDPIAVNFIPYPNYASKVATFRSIADIIDDPVSGIKYKDVFVGGANFTCTIKIGDATGVRGEDYVQKDYSFNGSVRVGRLTWLEFIENVNDTEETSHRLIDFQVSGDNISVTPTTPVKAFALYDTRHDFDDSNKAVIMSGNAENDITISIAGNARKLYNTDQSYSLTLYSRQFDVVYEGGVALGSFDDGNCVRLLNVDGDNKPIATSRIPIASTPYVETSVNESTRTVDLVIKPSLFPSGQDIVKFAVQIQIKASGLPADRDDTSNFNEINQNQLTANAYAFIQVSK